jgi:hypothetical protein
MQIKSNGGGACYVAANNGNVSITMIPMPGKGGISNNATSAYRQESADVSVTGVVSGETSDFISSNCALSSSVFTCTLVTSVFSATPQCDVSLTGTTAGSAPLVNPASATSVVVRTFDTSGSASDRSFTIKCWGPR